MGCCFGRCLGLPVQVVAGSVDFVAFLVLLALFLRRGSDGLYIFLFLTFYGAKRVALGFFRGDATRIYHGLTIFQLLGVVFAMAGLVGLAVWWWERRRTAALTPCEAPPAVARQ